MQWGLNIGQQRLHFVQAHWNASYWVGSDVFWSIFSDYFFNDVSLWEDICQDISDTRHGKKRISQGPGLFKSV